MILSVCGPELITVKTGILDHKIEEEAALLALWEGVKWYFDVAMPHSEHPCLLVSYHGVEQEKWPMAWDGQVVAE